MKRRQRNRNRRKLQHRKNKVLVPDASNHRLTDVADDAGEETVGDRQQTNATTLTHAIRATGIIPIAVLFGILVTHHFYTAHIPQWFHPIVENQVAVLTLCAGHAGIIGISINIRTQDKHIWSTFALVIAAFATAGAGYRAIGESEVGHVVIIILFLLLIPAIWAEFIITVPSRAWRFVRSKKGVVTVLVSIGSLAAIYNQSQNENYIRDWILIPFGIIVGFIASSIFLWVLLRLVFKYLPVAYSWFKQRLASVLGGGRGGRARIKGTALPGSPRRWRRRKDLR